MRLSSAACEFFVPDSDDPEFCFHYIPSDGGSPVGLCKQPGKFQCILDHPVISHSGRISWVHCRQKWYFSHIKGIRLKDEHLPFPMVAGIIWDRFIQSVYEGRKFRDEFDGLCKRYVLYPDAIAKLHALIKSYHTIGFKVEREGAELQKPFFVPHLQAVVRGFIDVAYPDHIIEVKSSSDPTRYHKLFAITSQAATYFLSNPDYKYINVQAVKVPQLKFNEKKEDLSYYRDRCHDHIIKNVKQYYPGADLDKGTYGKRFYRSEFPLEQIAKDYEQIHDDMRVAFNFGRFYQNFMACYVPTTCQYLTICQTGVVSDELYDFKGKEGGNETGEDGGEDDSGSSA